MKKKRVFTLLEQERRMHCVRAIKTLRENGFTIPDISKVALMSTRTLWRIVKGETVPDHDDTSAIQSAALAVLMQKRIRGWS